MGEYRSGDGAQIAFSDEGEGRPLVLLHGLMAHSGFFKRQVDLASEFRLVRIDLRGHGKSRLHGGAATLDALAGDVAAICAQLDLQDAIGVGWSLGASVLWRLLAGPASDRFAGAVVIDMTPRVLNDGSWTLGLTRETCDARSAAMADDFPAFAAAAGQAIFASPNPDAAWAAGEFERSDSRAVGAIWSSLVDSDLRPSLAAIRQPTLVVHGAQSHLYGPGTADHLVEALPNASGRRFEKSGHAPHLEQPELFNSALRDFAAMLPPVRQVQATN